MELKETNHSYYCSDTNFYVGNHNGENFGRSEHDTWQDFKEVWFMNAGIDHDYNHCFRFDIIEKIDPETDEKVKGKYALFLYFILQRKGIFRPVVIKEISDNDIADIEVFLNSCWDYLKAQWEEISIK